MDISASFRTPVTAVSENVDKPVRRWYVRCLNKPHLIEEDPESPCPVAPEALRKDICGKRYVAFPLVAAKKFQFHDLVMQAAGRPWTWSLVKMKMTTRVKTRRSLVGLAT
jgi:hypothetical protein